MKYPMVLLLPMRWSHSVLVAQQIHEEVLRGCEIDRKISVQEEREVGACKYGPYTDDYFSVGTNARVTQ